MNKTRIQLLALAAAMALLTTVLGTSAFLTDEEELSKNLTMKTGSDFGIKIADMSASFDTATASEEEMEQHDGIITPGGSESFEPYLSNDGYFNAYVFMQIDMPTAEFSIDDPVNGWTAIYSSETSTIYAYGSASELSILGSKTGSKEGDETPAVCSEVMLSSNTSLTDGDSCEFTATGYAINAEDDSLESHNPIDVWNTINPGFPLEHDNNAEGME